MGGQDYGGMKLSNGIPLEWSAYEFMIWLKYLLRAYCLCLAFSEEF